MLDKDGLYIIEDWGCSFNAPVQLLPYFAGQPELANRIVQCMAVNVRRLDVIQSVTVLQNMAIIKKETRKFRRESFRSTA
jgi:hypothetical protein